MKIGFSGRIGKHPMQPYIQDTTVAFNAHACATGKRKPHGKFKGRRISMSLPSVPLNVSMSAEQRSSWIYPG